MNSKRYKITCLNCKNSDEITIVNDMHVDERHSTTNHIISWRKRLDNDWGFECRCGNYSILTNQEQRQITDKQNPDPKEIAEVVRNLKPEKAKFHMVSS